MLLGDAAGFYDPFTGEGVTLALRGAELAGTAIAEALARGGPGRCRASRPTSARATPRRAPSSASTGRCSSPSPGRTLANTLARKLKRRPDLADRLVGIAGDFVPARAAFGPAFLLDLITA